MDTDPVLSFQVHGLGEQIVRCRVGDPAQVHPDWDPTLDRIRICQAKNKDLAFEKNPYQYPTFGKKTGFDRQEKPYSDMTLKNHSGF